MDNHGSNLGARPEDLTSKLVTQLRDGDPRAGARAIDHLLAQARGPVHMPETHEAIHRALSRREARVLPINVRELTMLRRIVVANGLLGVVERTGENTEVVQGI